MKTAAEWMRDESLLSEALVQAIIDDARAGMVPECELQEAKSRDELNGECIMLMREHLARVGIESTFADDAADLAAQTIEKLKADLAEARKMYADQRDYEESLVLKHEAELAKAWEAGRDAAATKVDNWNGDGEDNPRRLPATGSMIRALQPPGGKAK